MKAMRIHRIVRIEENSEPLSAVDIPIPDPGPGEILLKVQACGVCHTELDEIEGRTPPPNLPVIPGHQVIGQVVRQGVGANRYQEGTRVGVAWINSACGQCAQCLAGRENLCLHFRATGRDV